MKTKLLLVLVGLVARGLFAAEALNFDFDDNIMVTPARILVWDEIHGREVAVSTADWALIKNRVGKVAPWKHFTLRPEGLRFFGDTSPSGAELFREQLAKALTAADGKWKGPRWRQFVDAMSDPEQRERAAIITARLHSPEAILRGLSLLKERGLLPALPKKENIHAVLWPGFPAKYRGATSAESKANVMRELLDRLEQEAPAAGTSAHRWEFSDDDFDNFEKAYQALEPEVEAGRWPHVRITLSFTGTNHPGKRPYSIDLPSSVTGRQHAVGQ